MLSSPEDASSLSESAARCFSIWTSSSSSSEPLSLLTSEPANSPASPATQASKARSSMITKMILTIICSHRGRTADFSLIKIDHIRCCLTVRIFRQVDPTCGRTGVRLAVGGRHVGGGEAGGEVVQPVAGRGGAALALELQLPRHLAVPALLIVYRIAPRLLHVDTTTSFDRCDKAAVLLSFAAPGFSSSMAVHATPLCMAGQHAWGRAGRACLRKAC